VTNDAPAPHTHPDVQRCSLWSRAEGLRPAGTAGTPAGFLLVDWPLPWPGDLGEVEELADVRRLAAASGLRVQATVPIDGRPARVAVYERSRAGAGPAEAGPAAMAGGFTGYQGREIDAGPGADGVIAAAAALLEGGEEGEAGGTPVAGGEVLICTHGRRDSCCGSFGTTLAMELTGPGGIKGGRAGSLGVGLIDRPVRRTSHTGGHRFAPTSIVLPEGTLWAFADRDLLSRVTAREGPLDDVAPRYRGCAGLDSAPLQALEAGVLAETGWSLFDSDRAGEHLGDDRYRLRVTGPSSGDGGEVGAGSSAVWEATVAIGRRLSQPVCGSPVDAGDQRSGKSTSEWKVQDLRRIA
jgi:hypothetical protein